ncbi:MULTISPECIES: hypothetical protein [Cupriavidus]
MLNDGKDMQSAPSAGVQQAAPVALPFAVLDALRFYANGLHFNINDRDAWDTVSGEPQNYWCDEAGISTVEDGSIAKAALQGVAFTDGEDADPIDGEVYTAAPAPSASPAVPQPSAKALTDAKDWLLDVMGEWDFTIPAGAFDKIVALLAAEQPSEDERDAERYRWLRDVHIGDDPEAIELKPARHGGLDSAIDAAIQRDREGSA